MCKREREREREKEGGREGEMHARASRKCGRALSVPHSVSQSACVIIISIQGLALKLSHS